VIEERGLILSLEGDMAWVETQRTSACGSCDAEQGCGTALLAKSLGNRAVQVRAENPLQAQPGEQVVLGLDEAAFVKASLALYLIPMLGLLLGAGLGLTGARHWLGSGSELASILSGTLGLMLGLLWGRRFGRRTQADRRYRAVVLRRLSGASVRVRLQSPSHPNPAVS
jgi:sigma-E factor negative regulatory protein RseC